MLTKKRVRPGLPPSCWGRYRRQSVSATVQFSRFVGTSVPGKRTGRTHFPVRPLDASSRRLRDTPVDYEAVSRDCPRAPGGQVLVEVARGGASNLGLFACFNHLSGYCAEYRPAGKAGLPISIRCGRHIPDTGPVHEVESPGDALTRKTVGRGFCMSMFFLQSALNHRSFQF